MRKPDNNKRIKEALCLTETSMLALSELTKKDPIQAEDLLKEMSDKESNLVYQWQSKERHSARSALHGAMMSPNHKHDRKIMLDALSQDPGISIKRIKGERHFLLHRGINFNSPARYEETDTHVTYEHPVSMTGSKQKAHVFADQDEEGDPFVHSVWVPESKISFVFHHAHKIGHSPAPYRDAFTSRQNKREREVLVGPGKYQREQPRKYSIHIDYPYANQSKNPRTNDFDVITRHDNHLVGRALITHVSNKHIMVSDVLVDREHRRKGLATAMYQLAEQKSGKKLVPHPTQSPAAKKMWAQPHRPFGESGEVKKSDELSKELWGLMPESKEKIRPFHGWVSPEGEFHQMKDSDMHDDFLAQRGLPHGEDAHESYKKGWIATGRSGRLNIMGHPDVLSNPNHPAVQKVRQLLANTKHANFEEVGVMLSTDKETPTTHKMGWDVTKEHAVKFGLHKPASELGAFHKSEEEIKFKLIKLRDLMKRAKLEGHHVIPFAVKPGTKQKRSIEDKIRVLNHYLGDLYGKPPVKDLTPKEHLMAHGINKTEDDLVYLEHYSDQPHETIDPKFHGLGVSGQESKRKSDPSWVDRAYYYDAGTKPEASLVHKPYKHIVSLPKSKIYDLGKDPENFSHNAVDEMGFHSHNIIESRIKQAGYSGYRHSGSRMPNVVAVFDTLKPHKIEEPRLISKSDDDWSPSEQDQAAIGAITGQHESRFEAMRRLRVMGGRFREDALNHLAQNTQIRIAAGGKREFLLHRGMSGKEYKKHVTGKSVISHEERTSWTPKKDIARKFSTVVGKHAASAWIHEDKIVAIPRAYGFPEDHPHTKEYEVIIDPHTSERHSGNISKSDDDKDFEHRGWISPSGEFQEIDPDEFHDDRFEDRHTLSSQDVEEERKKRYNSGWISVGHLWGANACVHPGVLNNPNHPAMKTLRAMVGNWPGKEFKIERYGVAENRLADVNPRHFAAHGTIPEESVVAQFHKTGELKKEIQDNPNFPKDLHGSIEIKTAEFHPLSSKEYHILPNDDDWEYGKEITMGHGGYNHHNIPSHILKQPNHPAMLEFRRRIGEHAAEHPTLSIGEIKSNGDSNLYDNIDAAHFSKYGTIPSLTAQFHKSEGRLIKEMYFETQHDYDVAKPFHGWISPKGEFHALDHDEIHSEYIRHIEGVGSEEEAYHKGWISTGNGGMFSVIGNDEHLKNPNHPATQTLRQIVQKIHPEVDSFLISSDKHPNGYDVPRHLAERGLFNPPSKVAEFHKTESDFKPTFIGHKYSILTAHNPLFPTKSVGGNHGLEEELKQAGYKYEHTVGMYGGTHEPGFLVHNADPKHIEKLGEKYGQESVIHSDAGKHKMVFTNGPKKGQFHSGVIVQQYMEPPEDNYTTLERNGNKHHFRMEFDFDKLEKIDGIFEKLCELKKGVAQRLWPFNPQKDRPHEQEESDLAMWQAGEAPDSHDFSLRESAGPMPYAAKERALHKLSGVTKVRRAADGKREFLLHRGMSDEEHQKVVGPSHVSHEESSSWTPNRREAGVIGGAYGGKKIVSAWIHEDHITSVPKQYGELDPKADIRADEEGYKSPKGPNLYAHEHEVIVAGGHKSELHQEKENKFRNLQTMISAKKPLSYLPGPSKWLEHYGLKDAFKKTEEDDPCE